MAITLAAVTVGGLWMQAAVLVLVGVAITAGVYGGVALIVKADDAGVALAGKHINFSLGGIVRGIGRLLVKGMPRFLTALGVLGTAAMIWVGGGIIVHGLEAYGFHAIAQFIHQAAAHAAELVSAASGLLYWLVSALGSGLVGLVIGRDLLPLNRLCRGARNPICPSNPRTERVSPSRIILIATSQRSPAIA